jgi:hypothetical protein
MAFLNGSPFVSGKQRPQGTPSWEFNCKFYGLKSANKRHLEDRVVRDEKGNIVTSRQRDTYNKCKGCPVLYVLSHKLVSKHTTERIYIGRWKEEIHENHDSHLNPFSFHEHLKSTNTHQ